MAQSRYCYVAAKRNLFEIFLLGLVCDPFFDIPPQDNRLDDPSGLR
jgi:hypothetical protein